jgi:diamine N-acetyltransferase
MDKHAMLRLRKTTLADLDYVIRSEHSEENRAYIIPWSRERHIQSLSDPDLAHLIVETDKPVGYVILAGLLDPNQSVEFRRIVITEKGRGYGKTTIERVKELAFEGYNAHRLWLDVFDWNARAQHVYEASGFKREGMLRECLKTTDAQFESLVIMSILRHEYQLETSARSRDSVTALV